MKYLVTLLFITFIAFGCGGETDQEQTTDNFEGEGIEVQGAWARPASEGRMSAAYFLISNFNEEDDRLIGVESDVAQAVEIHESYEREEGMMGMRETPEVDLPSQSTVKFEQGGLHIMLIQTTRTLADGDTFELTLNFENNESQTIEVPVQL